MIRQKLKLGNYTYIIEYFTAKEDLVENPHKEYFYVLKNYDIMSNLTIDKDIYFINKSIYDKGGIIYPMPHNVSTGYSVSPSDFNINITEENKELHLFSLYDEDFNETSILCDKIRIYFPIINTSINAVFDIENFINDIKFHYFINDINNYPRYSETEFSVDHNIYSEFIEVYVPSLNELLYNSKILIKDYNINTICTNETDVSGDEDEINIYNGTETYIPFNILYYPFRILEYKINEEDETVLNKKSYIQTEKYINNQFFSTFNFILYPYVNIDVANKFVIDNIYLCITFNIDLQFKLISEIRFPYLEELNNYNDSDSPDIINSSNDMSSINDLDSFNDINNTIINATNSEYYGVPCLINNFSYPDSNNISLKESYLKFNGMTDEDYDFFVDDLEPDNDYIGEDLEGIKRTGFFIEMSKDSKFKEVFFKYTINIDENDDIIDNLIFPLNNIFESWDNVPSIIVARVTFVDKVSFTKIMSNPVFISKEWYKYLTEGSYKPKLKLNNIYKFNSESMQIENKTDLLFIDKINCTVVKSDNNEKYNIYKSNNAKIIYKPIFFRTTELQNITIKANVKQNIGVNLSEYMSKVETFKLILDNTEYIESGRNDIFVIFNINAKNISATSGNYIITDEDDEFISDGNWTLV